MTDDQENTDAQPLSVSVDVDRYAHYLENSDMSEEEKRLFLDALWSILMQFVDLGFGIHPVQEPCGKAEPNPRKPALTAPFAVECKSVKETNSKRRMPDLENSSAGEGNQS